VSKRERLGSNRPQWLYVHPSITDVALMAVAWTVGVVWILFSHGYYAPLMFGVVTLLAVIFVVLPFILFRLGRKGDAPPPPAFLEWADGQLDTATGPIDGREAAIMILLIPIALAVGMTALGLVNVLASGAVL
jgi:hypothetical protein